MRQRKQSKRNSMRFRVKRRRVGNHIRFKVEEGFFHSEEIQICCSGENSYLLGRGPKITRRDITSDDADRT